MRLFVTTLYFFGICGYAIALYTTWAGTNILIAEFASGDYFGGSGMATMLCYGRWLAVPIFALYVLGTLKKFVKVMREGYF